jgi:DNA-binding transcriptional MocR family regulator
MDENEMSQISAFLQARLEIEKPAPGEFSTSDFMQATGVPRTTAESQLQRAQERKLISSRKLGRTRYWKIVDQQAWQEWIESKEQ